MSVPRGARSPRQPTGATGASNPAESRSPATTANDRPSRAGRASRPGIATQPVEAALGRHDEEEHEFRSSGEHPRPVVELGTDLWAVLCGFVDLQADDCGAVASLEDDDAVRSSRHETCVAGH